MNIIDKLVLLIFNIIILKCNNFISSLQEHPPIVPVNTMTITCNDPDGDTSKMTVALGVMYDNIWQYTNKHMIIVYKTKSTNYDPYNHRLYLHNGQMLSMEKSYKQFFEKSEQSLKNVWHEMSSDDHGNFAKRFISLGLYMDQQSQFMLNFMISSNGKDFRHITFYGSQGTMKIDQKHYSVHISSIIMISGEKSDNFVQLLLIKSYEKLAPQQTNMPMVQVHWNNINNDNDLLKPFGYLCFSFSHRNAIRLQEQSRQCNTTIYLLQSIQYGFIIEQFVYLIATKFEENFVLYMDKNILNKRNHETKFYVKKLSEFFYCNKPNTDKFSKESHSVPKEPWPIKNYRPLKYSTTLQPFQRGQKPTKPPLSIDKDKVDQQQPNHPHQYPDNDDDNNGKYYRHITLILFTIKNIVMLSILFVVIFIIKKREKKEGVNVEDNSSSSSRSSKNSRRSNISTIGSSRFSSTSASSLSSISGTKRSKLSSISGAKSRSSMSVGTSKLSFSSSNINDKRMKRKKPMKAKLPIKKQKGRRSPIMKMKLKGSKGKRPSSAVSSLSSSSTRSTRSAAPSSTTMIRSKLRK